MTNQPLYVKYNLSRKKKFQLITQVKREEKEMYLYKYANDTTSQEFLRHIAQMYKILNKSKVPFKINRLLEQKDSYLKFEFIEGSSWLSDLENIASKDSFKLFIAELEKFHSLLKNFSSKTNILTSDFINIFGNYPKKHEYSLLYPGVLDLNFDNILKDANKDLHLIDYEWTFNFPIPERYILYRSIFNIFIELRYLQGKNITLTAVEKHFKFTKEEIKTYLKWEENFQKHVLKEDSSEIDLFGTREFLLSKHRSSKDFICTKEEKAFQEEKIKATEEELNDTQKELNDTQEELNDTQEELNDTQEELNDTQRELKISHEENIIKEEELQKIYNSKSWKITQPLREITKKIKDFNKQK